MVSINNIYRQHNNKNVKKSLPFQISDLRIIFSNGSLFFPPFASERYHHDVHSTIYRCKVSNSIGSVLSKEVHVRAGTVIKPCAISSNQYLYIIFIFQVVTQKYDVQVHDVYVISGNTAVLRCRVPIYVADYVLVTSWVQNGNVNIYPSTDVGGKYFVVETGDLYVINSSAEDSYQRYECRTVHKLTGNGFSLVNQFLLF